MKTVLVFTLLGFFYSTSAFADSLDAKQLVAICADESEVDVEGAWTLDKDNCDHDHRTACLKEGLPDMKVGVFFKWVLASEAPFGEFSKRR